MCNILPKSRNECLLTEYYTLLAGYYHFRPPTTVRICAFCLATILYQFEAKNSLISGALCYAYKDETCKYFANKGQSTVIASLRSNPAPCIFPDCFVPRNDGKRKRRWQA
jgi:hypothetical protein